MEQAIKDDILKDMLNSCRGRISIEDAKILYQTAIDSNAVNMLEIGAADGCSSMVLATVAQQLSQKQDTRSHLWSIEVAPKQRWRENIDRLGLKDYVTLIFGQTPWITLPREAIPIDYLVLDGKHQTKWVLVDYHYCEPYVRSGGLIIFHDWTGAKGIGKQVQRAVEIILETDNLEEVTRYESNSRGLIVFRKPLAVESFSRNYK